MATAIENPATDSLPAFLLGRGLVGAAGLERAQRLAGDSAERLGTVLLKLGLISESDLARAYGDFTGTPPMGAGEFPAAALLIEQLSPRFLKKSGLIPIADSAAGVTIAIADPTDTEAIAAVGYALGRPVHCRVALASDLAKAFETLYESSAGANRIVARFETSQANAGAKDAERLRDFTSEAPIIQAVNYWIAP